MEVAFEHQRTSTDNTKPKVAESENIGANHLGFAKFLFQHYCQYLELNHNHISAELAFNFYVNEKISSLLETPVNTESAKKTFYKELIQNTNLLTNHNFTSIITEINKEIEHHTQQRYPITYARANHLGFAKFLFQHYCQYLELNHNHISAELAFNFYVNEKISSLLETPVNTESAKKTFYKELIQNTNLLTNHNFTSIITEINKEIEHHTQQRYPITYASKDKGKLQTPAVTPRKIQPPAWKKNRVEFPSNPSYHYTPRSAINISLTDTFPSTATLAFGRFPFQSRQRKTELLGPYDFRISDPWEAAESEKEEEESEDQEFTYHRTHTVATSTTTSTTSITTTASTAPQPSNLDPMTYVPIAKLDNFTDKEDNAQVWLNDIEKAIAANGWNDARAMQVILYFLKDTANSWYQPN
ncbi:hypothetical protein G9A89_016446 [Geosiphon pyriformis]|nr:hypothetical protein G9A89_016446 [Geosiphon pyriformis]